MQPDAATRQRRKRTNAAYKQWRAVVSLRCPVCLKCGESSVQGHHVLGYAEHPSLAYEPSNGVSLCEPCHKAYHMKHGRNRGFGPESLRMFVDGPGSEVMTLVLLRNGIADLEKARHFLDLLIELEKKQEGRRHG